MDQGGNGLSRPCWPHCERPIPRYKEVNTIGEFERIALTRDLPEDGHVVGDSGTVVHVYEGGRGHEVEFFALSGRTITVATVMAKDVRPVGDEDVTHARTRERSEA